MAAFLGEGANEPWDIRSIFPDKSDIEVAEAAAAYFNRISEEYDQLPETYEPHSTDEQVPLLRKEDVIALLKRSKKPKSHIPGDMFPESVSRNYEKIAVPVTNIFNSITTSKEWPDAWKTEYQCCIPKVPSPLEIGQCRNISCTSYLSKVYELFILDEARKYVTLSKNQFGGEKGISSTHFVVDVWEKITSELKDSRAGVTLAGIDYSKAFNRLEHGRCLQELEGLGLPNHHLKILASFLTGRMMTVKVGEEMSAPRRVKAGAPQGSVLGSFLFNAGINNLEDGFQDHEQARETPEKSTCGEAAMASSPTESPPIIYYPESPVTGPGFELEFLPLAVNVPHRLRNEPKWKNTPLKINK